MPTPTVGQQGRRRPVRAREVIDLRFQPRAQPRRQIGRQAQPELRAALIGCHDGRGRVGGLQHLPALRTGVHLAWPEPGGDALLELKQARQQARRGARHHMWKVLPVVVVGHPQGVGAVAQALRQLPFVLKGPGAARAPFHPVRRQHIEHHSAFVTRLEVAKLGTQRQAASRAQCRRECGIAVGRDVPVVGDADLEAAAAVQPNAGRQPTRLACIRQRKTQHRQGQDGHTQEAQHGAVGAAFLNLGVETHPCRLQQPIRVTRPVARATAVDGVRGDRPRIIQKIDSIGFAA